MELERAQTKVVKSKPSNCSIIRGTNSSGKTTTAVYRAIYLKNNYCLYDNDNILFITCDSSSREEAQNMYYVAEKSSVEYITLFSGYKRIVNIMNISEIIKSFFNDYIKRTNEKLNYIDGEDQRELIQKCVDQIKGKYCKVKIFSGDNLSFFQDEIDWINACSYDTFDEYNFAKRVGRDHKGIHKNSITRKAIYEVKKMYNKTLKQKKLVDYSRMVSLALNEARISSKKYTHIIADDGQEYSKIEIEFINQLKKKISYSTSMFFVDKDEHTSPYSWIVKSRKLNELKMNIDEKMNLASRKTLDKKEENEKMKVRGSIDEFEFYDLKHLRHFDFYRDCDNISEVIVNDGNGDEVISSKETEILPVYSDIAAGEPIYINDEIESSFYVPSYWIRSAKDCFILTVKGDSMIGANINDGDMVLLRRQQNAQNNDIVAVDINGSATLKRLNIKRGRAVLMPENDNYSPIYITEEGASILGVAIGIIKTKKS